MLLQEILAAVEFTGDKLTPSGLYIGISSNNYCMYETHFTAVRIKLD